MLRTLGNIFWHIPFLGFLSALLCFLIGSFFTILVVTAPIGLGLIQYSKFLIAPYSYSMVSATDLKQNTNPFWAAYSFIVMIFYLPIGVVLALCTAIQAILCCLTITGLPVGIVLLKSLGTYLNPVNKVCVPVDVAYEIEARKNREQVANYFPGEK